jgi:uncharacterized protein YkwD
VRRSDKLLSLCFVAALAGCAETPDNAPINPHAPRDVSAVRLDPAAATAMLNAYRASQGVGAVRLDPPLSAMAQRQADAMAAANQMSHEVAGDFPSRLAASGVESVAAAENVGAGYYSLDEAMAGWRRSPGHDANLLMPDAKRFGIAIAKNPRTRYGVYWAIEMAGDRARRRQGITGGLSRRRRRASKDAMTERSLFCL